MSPGGPTPAAPLRQRQRRDPERLRGNAADAELGDEPVAVATVRRARELDDVAGGGTRDALEQERGRVERHAERARLLLVGDGRLDGLRAADDRDLIAADEQLV